MTLDLSSQGLRSDMYANPHKERMPVAAPQNSPVMQGWSDATARQKIAGIVDQVRLDLSRGHHHTAEELLRERFTQTRLEVDDDKVVALAMSLRGVDYELTRREEEARRAAAEGGEPSA
jgi:hypothetical protein